MLCPVAEVPTMKGSPDSMQALTPPIDLGDSVVPKSPSVTTPMRESTTRNTIEKSSLDFFSLEHAEAMPVIEDDCMDYNLLYANSIFGIKSEASSPGIFDMTPWGDTCSDSKLFSRGMKVESPNLLNTIMLGGLPTQFREEPETPRLCSRKNSLRTLLRPPSTPPTPPLVDDSDINDNFFDNDEKSLPDFRSKPENQFVDDTSFIVQKVEKIADNVPACPKKKNETVHQSDEENFSPVAIASTDKDEEQDRFNQTNETASVRRGQRKRRPPRGLSESAEIMPPKVHRQKTGNAGKGSKVKENTGLSKKTLLETARKGGGVRKRPVEPMSVEDRVLAIFGEDALRLDRDAFKIWRSATEIPALTTCEQSALKRLRRRLLGRTYAKRSRDRQVALTSHVEEQCRILQEENESLRQKILEIQELIDERGL